MSANIRSVVTRGFGNGTYAGEIGEVVNRGFTGQVLQVILTGVSATGSVGTASVLIWTAVVVSTESENWTDVVDAQSGTWTDVVDAQTTVWKEAAK